MLLLAHLLNLAPGWRHNRLVLRTVADDERGAEHVRTTFETMLPDLRMEVRLDVIIKPEGTTHVDVIRKASTDADMLFMGIAVPEAGRERPYADELMNLLDGLPTTILVRNSSRFQGRLV